MKEKPLSEMRKELLKYFKEQFGEDSIIPKDILRVVTEQDKSVQERLKKRFSKRTFFVYSPEMEKESSMKIIDDIFGSFE